MKKVIKSQPAKNIKVMAKAPTGGKMKKAVAKKTAKKM